MMVFLYPCAPLLLSVLNSANGYYPHERSYTPRIIGGVEATPHEFPWIVEIIHDEKHLCGGSIVEANLVVTAAHCIYKDEMNLYKIVAGEHNREAENGLEQERVPSKYLVHAEYVGAGFDIALIWVDPPFDLNEFVKPVGLPAVGYEPTDVATVAGWGRTSCHGEYSSVLKKADITYLPDAECKKRYPRLDPEIACFLPTQGSASCIGDSGGPLICGEDPVLCGLVSSAVGQCPTEEIPTFFTEISYFTEWIRENE